MKLCLQFEVSERNQHTSFIQVELDNATCSMKNVKRFVFLTTLKDTKPRVGKKGQTCHDF